MDLKCIAYTNLYIRILHVYRFFKPGFIETLLCLMVFIFFIPKNIFGQCTDKEKYKDQIQKIADLKEKVSPTQLIILKNIEENIKSCPGFDSIRLFLCQQKGNIFFHLENYDSAFIYTNEAVSIAKNYNFRKNDYTLSLSDSYYNLFYYNFYLGHNQQMLRAIDSCLAYFLKDNTANNRAVGLLPTKIEHLLNLGEYDLSNKLSKLGEAIVKKYFTKKNGAELRLFFLTSQAIIYNLSKDTTSAGILLENLVKEFGIDKTSYKLGPVYVALGINAGDKGDTKKALEFFKKALVFTYRSEKKVGYSQNLIFIGSITGKAMGKYDLGIKYCLRSLQYADGSDSLFAFRELGNLYALKTRFDSAHYFFQQAYNTVRNGFSVGDLLKDSFSTPGFNQLQSLSDLATSEGDAWGMQYDFTRNPDFLKKAIEVFKINDRFISKIKSDHNLNFISSLKWRSTARNLYEKAIEICYKNNNFEDAFYFFEKSRAILLNDQISELFSRSNKQIQAEFLQKKKIRELEEELKSIISGTDKFIYAQKKLCLATIELGRLRNSQLKNQSGTVSIETRNSVLTLKKLNKHILKKTKTILEIFSGDSAVYILTISPKYKNLLKLEKNKYADLVTEFNAYVSDKVRINSDFSGYRKTANSLYQLIFPVAPPDGSLIISPDGIGFPFEALILNKANDPDYFLNHYAISYAYSVNYLTNNFAKNESGENNLLGIAPIVFPSSFKLSPLARSDQSLKIINSYFVSSSNVVSNAATRNNFLKKFPSYKIVQLYTHATGGEGTKEPIIFFSDSLLYLEDLLPDRKPITQLVVLSACETAIGKVYMGEGVFSFNRGFASLGIPAVISTLWSVETQATYQLTELFYKYLALGLPTDVALQKAKIEFINTSSSMEQTLPYFWAGPILTGRVDILMKAKPVFSREIIFSSVLIFLVIFLALYIRRRRKPL